MERNVDTHSWLEDDIAPKPWRLLLLAFDPFERLQYPHHGVCHLRERELLPDAYSRPAVEWDVCPRLWRPLVPAIWRELKIVRELFGSCWIDILTALEYEC